MQERPPAVGHPPLAERMIRRRYPAAGALVCVLIASGCAEQNGIFEIGSGPPVRRTAGFGAGIPAYAVHVGASATMRFRSKIGTCDYAVMLDESTGQYVDCGPCIKGQFEWNYLIAALGPTERSIRLTVSGYVQRGSRDRMPMDGALVEAGRPNDARDYKLAQATVQLQVYQSVVEVAVRLPKGQPDWALTKLLLTRADGQQTRISLSSAGEGGFQVTGPAEDGLWLVRYEPKASEVNQGGETVAVLQVADESGQITALRQSFATP